MPDTHIECDNTVCSLVHVWSLYGFCLFNRRVENGDSKKRIA